MSHRYRVELERIGLRVVAVLQDYCVEPGNKPVHIGSYYNHGHALDVAVAMNAQDDDAKAAFDTDTPNIDDTKHHHYLRYNGVTHVVRGTGAAMEAFRAMNRTRFQRNKEMQKRVVASQDEIANLRHQLHLAKLDVAQAERLRGEFDGRKFDVYLADGPHKETGPQLANRVQGLIAQLNEYTGKLESLRVALRDLAAR